MSDSCIKSAEIHGACRQDGCKYTGCEYADISAPIDLRPEVVIGCAETECIGKPKVACVPFPCESGCRIIVTQRVRVKIPISFDVSVTQGAGAIECRTCDSRSDIAE